MSEPSSAINCLDGVDTSTRGTKLGANALADEIVARIRLADCESFIVYFVVVVVVVWVS